MNENKKKEIGKFLSLILRHNPGAVGIILDENGWADTGELIEKCSEKGKKFNMEDLIEIVETNDKKRYSFNEDKTRIRANQGHSIEVELNLEVKTPPVVLYHGTVAKFIRDIQKDGLKKMSRQHVHLSADIETAKRVGSRRGVPIVLTIHAELMFKNGHEFFLSENEVWLTNAVPSEYITFK